MLNTHVLCHAAPQVANTLKAVGEGEEDVKLEFVNISSQAAGLLARSLCGSRVTVLTVTACGIGDKGVEALGQVLLETRITHLNIASNAVRSLEGAFLNAVGYSRTLQGLNSSGNPLSRSTLSGLCRALGTSSITDLDLSSCGALVCPTDLALASQSLSILRIGHNASWPCDCTLFLNLDAQTTLTVLDLASSEVGGRCEEIRGALQCLKYLKCLSLEHNSICPTGLVHIAEGVKGCPSLEELSLASNPLAAVPGGWAYNEKGVIALALVLKLASLRRLSLASCRLGYGTNAFYDGTDHGGISFLCDTAKQKPSMQVVCLADNQFNEKTITILKRVACGKVSFDPLCPVAAVASPSTPFRYGHYRHN